MKFKLDTNYSEQELEFMDKHNCEILCEVRFSKTNFSGNEIPHRMFIYCDVYVAEIYDDEDDEMVWAVLTKKKGRYVYSCYLDSLESLELCL